MTCHRSVNRYVFSPPQKFDEALSRFFNSQTTLRNREHKFENRLSLLLKPANMNTMTIDVATYLTMKQDLDKLRESKHNLASEIIRLTEEKKRVEEEMQEEAKKDYEQTAEFVNACKRVQTENEKLKKENEQLKEKIDELEDQVTTLQYQNDMEKQCHEREFGDLQSDAEDLRTEVQDLKEELSTVEKDYAELKERADTEEQDYSDDLDALRSEHERKLVDMEAEYEERMLYKDEEHVTELQDKDYYIRSLEEELEKLGS